MAGRGRASGDLRAHRVLDAGPASAASVPRPSWAAWAPTAPGSRLSPLPDLRLPSSPVPQVCMSTFEHEMEKAFAFQASQDKVCSICMEVILEKASASERRFGILSSCNHTYCLSCIRQWRCAKQFENPIIK